MIALLKIAEPQILADNGSRWTNQYLAARGTEAEHRAEHWRHSEIKQALAIETSSKCAYCESYMEDVSFPHVEHIKPKSRFPELAHHWDNLTSACERCNVAKQDFYDPVVGLLNPYVDDLDLHLRFHGDFLNWALGSDRGLVTVSKLQLNRVDLVRSRLKRLESVRGMLDSWHRAEEPLRSVMAGAIRDDISHGEYTSAVLALVSALGLASELGL